jgi:hypothetical protein
LVDDARAQNGELTSRRTRTAATSPGSKHCIASGCHSIVPQTNASQWCLCTASLKRRTKNAYYITPRQLLCQR